MVIITIMKSSLHLFLKSTKFLKDVFGTIYIMQYKCVSVMIRTRTPSMRPTEDLVMRK